MQPATRLGARVVPFVLGMAAVAAAIGPAHISGKEPKRLSPTIERKDAVYGAVHGAGLLADIAYPSDPQLPLPAIISVHGGRWVGGNKRDASAINVQQWASYGYFAM